MKAGMKALWAALLLAGPLLAGCDKGADPATAKGAPPAVPGTPAESGQEPGAG